MSNKFVKAIEDELVRKDNTIRIRDRKWARQLAEAIALPVLAAARAEVKRERDYLAEHGEDCPICGASSLEARSEEVSS